MSTSKKNSSESVEAAGKVDMTGWTLEQKREYKLEQLKKRAKKQKQLLTKMKKDEAKKSCMPIGKAILQKSSELKVEVNVLDAVNYFGAGLILIKMARSLKAKGREEFVAMAERNSNNDSETIAFLKRVVQIEVPNHTLTKMDKIAAIQKTVDDFKIEPDNGEVPF